MSASSALQGRPDDPPPLSPHEARRMRGFARMFLRGEISASDAREGLVRADRNACLWAAGVVWNPVHHLWIGAPEPRDEDFWADQLYEAIDREEAREADAAQPALAPAFPSRGVTLDEGQRVIREEVRALARRIGRGEAPEILLRVTVGGGKSEAAIADLGLLLDEAHAAGREGALFYMVPNHVLSAEVRDRIAAANPDRPVAIWRGLGAEDPEADQPEDPEAPRVGMCLAPELPNLARAAGVRASTVCKACPLRGDCGYRRQAKQDAAIWIMAHNGAFRPLPAALPPAAVIVCDEDFTATGLVGADPNEAPLLPFASLAEERTGTLTEASRDRLIALRAMGFGAAANMEEGTSLRRVIEAAGFTVETLDEWAALEWATAPKVALGGMGREEIAEALRIAAASGFNRLRPRLAHCWADLLRSPDARSVQVEHVAVADLGRGRGTGPAIRLSWRQDFAKWCREVPKLFLGATTPAAILRHWAPVLEVRDVEIATPGQHVVQVPWEFGRRYFTKNPANVERLANLVSVELAMTDGPVLVVSQVAVEDRLRTVLKRRFGGKLPERLRLAHFGNLVGLNAHADVATILVVGRPAINRKAAERLAGIVQGSAVAALDMDGAAWPMVEAGIRMADGSAAPTQQPQHPDPTVEALRWAISEGSVLQGMGRARGVRRPVRAVYLGALALPLTVAETRAWEDAQPERIAVAMAEAAIAGRALLLAPADLSAARPDLWATPKAVEREREKGAAKTPLTLISKEGGLYKAGGGFIPALYRKPDAKRWSHALVPAIGGLKALAAEMDRLGLPLAASKLALLPAQPAPADAARIAPTHPAEPVQQPQGSPHMAAAPPPVSMAARLRLALLAQRLETARPDPLPPLKGIEPDYEGSRRWWVIPNHMALLATLARAESMGLLPRAR